MRLRLFIEGIKGQFQIYKINVWCVSLHPVDFYARFLVDKHHRSMNRSSGGRNTIHSPKLTSIEPENCDLEARL